MTITEFRSQLCASGLMEPGEVDSAYDDFVREHSNEKSDVTANEWSKHLVQRKRATLFQVSALFVNRPPVLVFDRFEILDKLAAGGMGDVYRAIDRKTATPAVVKVLPCSAAADEEMVKRFNRETRLLLQLQHPHIVGALAAGEVRGCHYLAMEYVEGLDLGRIVRNRGALKIEDAIECTLQAARGLEYAHNLGIVHRDVKPSNLMLDHTGTVKILDLGLARLLGDDNPLTHTGSVLGSVDYMAPEQASESKDADRRADIYSLGCTMYYLLVGRTVFEATTVTKKVLAHQETPPPALNVSCPGAPTRLVQLFKRMLVKNPRDRIGSMKEVIKSLERVQKDSSLPAPDLNRLARPNSEQDSNTAPVNGTNHETLLVTPKKTRSSDLTSPRTTVSMPSNPKEFIAPVTRSSRTSEWQQWALLVLGGVAIVMVVVVVAKLLSLEG